MGKKAKSLQPQILHSKPGGGDLDQPAPKKAQGKKGSGK